MKLFLSILLLSSCALKDPKEPKIAENSGKETEAVSLESKQLASEKQTPFVTEIQFQEAKSNVSDKARAELKKLYKEASRKGKISEVQIITWGDREYPSEKDKELSEQQKKLVDLRNKSLTQSLNKMSKDLDVNTFSMAERPGKMDEMFNSESASIKESLETAGIPTTDKSAKVPGKASKSVVIFIMEEG